MYMYVYIYIYIERERDRETEREREILADAAQLDGLGRQEHRKEADMFPKES